jgi:magnesium-protoporphyrin O-methyltransferase
VNRELSPAYDEEARRLLEEVGLEDKIERCLGDIAVDGTGVTPADVVVLHRVVCCYPDYDRLLTAAAEHAKRLVVFSYPPRERNLPSRCDSQNLVFKLRRKEFRTFAHPPNAMLAVFESHGFRRALDRHGFVWQVAGLER